MGWYPENAKFYDKPVDMRDSVADKVRWSEHVWDAVGNNYQVIWEECEVDYQGYAEVLLMREPWSWRDSGGRFIFYQWSHGSCSGCDDWEDEPTYKVMKEILGDLSIIEGGDELKKFLKIDQHISQEHKDAVLKTYYNDEDD